MPYAVYYHSYTNMQGRQSGGGGEWGAYIRNMSSFFVGGGGVSGLMEMDWTGKETHF